MSLDRSDHGRRGGGRIGLLPYHCNADQDFCPGYEICLHRLRIVLQYSLKLNKFQSTTSVGNLIGIRGFLESFFKVPPRALFLNRSRD